MWSWVEKDQTIKPSLYRTTCRLVTSLNTCTDGSLSKQVCEIFFLVSLEPEASQFRSSLSWCLLSQSEFLLYLLEKSAQGNWAWHKKIVIGCVPTKNHSSLYIQFNQFSMSTFGLAKDSSFLMVRLWWNCFYGKASFKSGMLMAKDSCVQAHIQCALKCE